MEYLNNVHLKGVVGSTHLSQVGNIHILILSLVTNQVFTSSDGTVIETTWHTAVAFESDTITVGVLQTINKGTQIELNGRLRNKRYTTSDGQERITYEIVATELKIIPKVDKFIIL